MHSEEFAPPDVTPEMKEAVNDQLKTFWESDVNGYEKFVQWATTVNITNATPDEKKEAYKTYRSQFLTIASAQVTKSAYNESQFYLTHQHLIKSTDNTQLHLEFIDAVDFFTSFLRIMKRYEDDIKQREQ